MKKHFYLFFLVIVTFLYNCSDEKFIYEEFIPPTFEILSYNTISDDECLIEIELNPGVGAKLQFLDIEFKDITNSTNEIINKKITIERDDKHTIEVKVEFPNKKHDYRTHITLKSTKNTYESKPFIIRFSDEFIQNGINFIELYIGSNEISYVSEEQKIGLYMKPRETFLFIVHYSKIPNKNTKTEIKLNGEIPIKTEIEYSGWVEDGEVHGFGTLPEHLPSGVYKIHVYIDNVEYILEYEVKILRGRSEIFDIDPRPGKENYLGPIVNYFMIKDDAYYIHDGGGYWYVLCFNMKTMKWEKKKNILINEPYHNSQVLKDRVSSENQSFILLNMYKTGFDNIPNYEHIQKILHSDSF